MGFGQRLQVLLFGQFGNIVLDPFTNGESLLWMFLVDVLLSKDRLWLFMYILKLNHKISNRT